MRPLAIVPLSLAALSLASCGNSGGNAPGAVSEGEAQALEEAAEMLDAQRLPEGTLPPPPTAASEDAQPAPEVPQE